MFKTNNEVDNPNFKFIRKNNNNVKDITLKEKIFKGQDITVSFLGEKKNLSDLQLTIFVNGELKYSSKKGVFAIKTISTPKVVRNGWKFSTEMTNKSRIVFEEKKDYDNFIGFCVQLRDCIRVQNMFEELCYEYVEGFEDKEPKDTFKIKSVNIRELV